MWFIVHSHLASCIKTYPLPFNCRPHIASRHSEGPFTLSSRSSVRTAVHKAHVSIRTPFGPAGPPITVTLNLCRDRLTVSCVGLACPVGVFGWGALRLSGILSGIASEIPSGVPSGIVSERLSASLPDGPEGSPEGSPIARSIGRSVDRSACQLKS